VEFEALFLGLEPIAALAVGIGAIMLAPLVSVVTKAVNQDQNLSQSLSDSVRDVTKNTLVWGFEALENAQTIFSEAGESCRDLVADAKSEHLARKTALDNAVSAQNTEPRTVEIVSD
jgi:hypothetical protein